MRNNNRKNIILIIIHAFLLHCLGQLLREAGRESCTISALLFVADRAARPSCAPGRDQRCEGLPKPWPLAAPPCLDPPKRRDSRARRHLRRGKSVVEHALVMTMVRERFFLSSMSIQYFMTGVASQWKANIYLIITKRSLKWSPFKYL